VTILGVGLDTMPADDYTAAQWALLAIEEGWSATAGLNRFRAEGGHIANATWYKLTGELRANIGDRERVMNAPMNRIPTADEIKDWTTKSAKGYVQQVEVLIRDKTTGEVISVAYSRMGKTLISRNGVIKEALDTYGGENAKRYPWQRILGAVYTGTYQAIPEG